MYIMTCAGGTLQADVINLTDGSRIIGTLDKLEADKVTITGTLAGDLTLPRDALASLETEQTVTLVLADGSYITGRLTLAAPDRQIIQVDDLGQRPLALTQIGSIYREDPLTLQRKELAVKVDANANVGVNVTSGNSQTEDLHVDGQLVTRTRRNRYTLSGEYNQEKSDDVLVKKNWTGLVKYDYFVSDKWFWFNSATFESDRFADLDLRSALAAGVGYQFFETDERKLSVEFGPSYVNENFDVAEDNSFVGARWAVNYEQHLWDGLTFYHYDEGLQGLEDTSDLTIRTRTGLRMNVTDHVVARVQTAIDWDKSPPADADGTDYEHTLTIGYRF